MCVRVKNRPRLLPRPLSPWRSGGISVPPAPVQTNGARPGPARCERGCAQRARPRAQHHPGLGRAGPGRTRRGGGAAAPLGRESGPRWRVRVLRAAAVFPGPSMARCCWLSLRLIGAGCAGLPTGSERSPAGTPLLTSSCWDSATFPAKPGFIMCVCTAAPAARSGGGKGARTKKREGGWRELKKIKTQGSSGSSGSNEGRSGATFQRITHGGS